MSPVGCRGGRGTVHSRYSRVVQDQINDAGHKPAYRLNAVRTTDRGGLSCGRIYRQIRILFAQQGFSSISSLIVESWSAREGLLS